MDHLFDLALRSALSKGRRARGPARIVEETREQRSSEGSYPVFGVYQRPAKPVAHELVSRHA
jgi:hypothetical protein